MSIRQQNLAFADTLDDYLEASGLRRKQLIDEVNTHYGSQLTLREADLSQYLAGKALPTVPKLAAITDALGLTNAEIARLLRMTIGKADD